MRNINDGSKIKRHVYIYSILHDYPRSFYTTAKYAFLIIHIKLIIIVLVIFWKSLIYRIDRIRNYLYFI